MKQYKLVHLSFDYLALNKTLVTNAADIPLYMNIGTKSGITSLQADGSSEQTRKRL